MSSHDSNVASMSKSEVKRRNLVKGAAWTVPVVAVAAAAPMAAASPIPPRGLNGWVTLRRNCSQNPNFRIDGLGNFTGGGANDRGIWTFVNDPNATLTNAEIVFFFNRSNLSFTNGSQGGGWSNLVRVQALDGTSPANGYYAYRATYTGTWTYFPQYQAWSADGDPYWSTNIGSCNSGISGYARRTLTVNGETITFTRGPVSV